jgi:hypothetical protein
MINDVQRTPESINAEMRFLSGKRKIVEGDLATFKDVAYKTLNMQRKINELIRRKKNLMDKVSYLISLQRKESETTFAEICDSDCLHCDYKNDCRN